MKKLISINWFPFAGWMFILENSIRRNKDLIFIVRMDHPPVFSSLFFLLLLDHHSFSFSVNKKGNLVK